MTIIDTTPAAGLNVADLRERVADHVPKFIRESILTAFQMWEISVRDYPEMLEEAEAGQKQVQGWFHSLPAAKQPDMQRIIELSEKIGFEEGVIATDEWLYLEPETRRLKEEHIAEMKVKRIASMDVKPNSLAADPQPDADLEVDGYGCTCASCGRKYKFDLNIPDSIWEKIIRDGEELLCGICIMQRIEQLHKFGYLCVNNTGSDKREPTMNNNQHPHRRHRIELTIEADSMDDLAGEFNHLAFLASSDQLGTGNSFSAGGGSSYQMRHVLDHHMDHDKYQKQVSAHLGELETVLG